MQHLMFLQNVKREKMKKHPSSKHGPTLSDFGVLCSNIHEYVFFIYNICKKKYKNTTWKILFRFDKQGTR
jgi:hypothetical protein